MSRCSILEDNRQKRGAFLVLSLFLLLSFIGSTDLYGKSLSPEKTGFLVLAPDRGFMGNQEIEAVFDTFSVDYPAALALVGSKFNGLSSEYSVYLQEAVEALKKEGVTKIVALPLFFSSANPVLKKITSHLPKYIKKEKIHWAAPMGKSYLTAQILLDRVKAMSHDPAQERLVVLGMGAVNEQEEKVLRVELENIAQYVRRYLPLKEVEVGIYYDRMAKAALRKEKNEVVLNLVIKAAAKKGRALVVPFFIGPKFSTRMSMTSWLRHQFEEFDLVFNSEGIFPHPNILLWLRKTANSMLPPTPGKIGIVIMPHGATLPWNTAVEASIAPLESIYPIEMAYGMGDAQTIAEAVARLEKKGITRIVFVRMYALAHHMKESSDYILGLSDLPSGQGSKNKRPPPAQIRSAVSFTTFGGYEEDVAIAEILHDRIMEISKNPGKETVILLAHGSGSDEANAAWLKVINTNITHIKKMLKLPFRDIIAATVREDWPDKREEAVAQVKALIKKGNRDGRVLIVVNRLFGSGPYAHLLEGETYKMNRNGFLPHPMITLWLEKGINRAVRTFSREKMPLVSSIQTKDISQTP